MKQKEVILQVDGLRIAGQLYLPGESKAGLYPAVCLCHGIPAGRPDPSDRGYPLLAERICGQGFAVFIFNFRGTGASEGNLDLMSWTRDLVAAIDFLDGVPEVDKSRRSVLGFSGGAAVSVYVAAKDTRIVGVVACACPAEFSMMSNPQAAIEHFRSIGVIRDPDFPHSVEEWISGFRLVSPLDYVAAVAPRPILLVHGSSDEVVAVSQAHRLYARAQEPKQIVIIDGAGHRLRQDERAMALVIDWLKSHYLR
jgi:dipeptidyl aminopeptidase/acylaminoacyl peptidase